ncbi:MAG: protein translocase subunit SecD [Chlamydiia bacterium]
MASLEFNRQQCAQDYILSFKIHIMVVFSMEKQKRWHSWLIAGVTLLTVYNILPTIFFYANPLSEKIDAKRAIEIQNGIADRVNRLEEDALLWIHSFNELIDVKAKSVELNPKFPDSIEVNFNQSQDAKKFSRLLPKAGGVIPFYPSQLSLGIDTADPLKIEVQRKVPITFNQQERQDLFRFVEKYEAKNQPTNEYRQIVLDRVFEVGYSIGGNSESAQLVAVATQNPEDPRAEEPLLNYVQMLLDYKAAFGENSTPMKRFIASLSQANIPNKTNLINTLQQALSATKERLQKERLALSEEKVTQGENEPAAALNQEKIQQLLAKEQKVRDALYIVNNRLRDFNQGAAPFTPSFIETSYAKNSYLPIGKNNALIGEVRVDFEKEMIVLSLQEDVKEALNDADSSKKELIQSLIYKELARINVETNEEFKPQNQTFASPLADLASSKSLLVLSTNKIFEKAEQRASQLLNSFEPQTIDLQKEQYPVVHYNEYLRQPADQQSFEIVLYSPCLEEGFAIPGFKNDSSYIIFKDFYKIYRKYAGTKTDSSQVFNDDLKQLSQLLTQQGYVAYPGSVFPLTKEFTEDLIFELQAVAEPTLAATRELFQLKGSKKGAILELSDVRQRILTVNSIESKEQEDLLRSKDLYNAGQVDPTQRTYFDAPKPIRSPLWNNLMISAKKYFRGDDRKILKWGLDLSGGKTVEIQLKDPSGKTVTNEFDLKQGVNELFNRVNKMGVSEVSIRIEGSNIILDFPGSQDISASDLIRSSSMTFHVVNEKFSGFNRTLKDVTNRFLQEVWSEAVVTGKKGVEDINRIAYSHLYGESDDPDAVSPKSESAQALYQAGLQLAHPDSGASSTFNDSLSRIAILKGESPTSWEGQTHPLLVVFNNYALEGSSLENVRASYDPKSGNFLSFNVQATKKNPNGSIESPQKTLATWTGVFCQEKIVGTELEQYSHAKGWRMAVILNGQVISSPSLNAEIKDRAMITGNFSQREVSKLEADLRAGSLSYTPQILSENNVSPELGLKERNQGIIAAIVALALVIVVMTAYYRFFGVVASCAVLFNLLIMWAALQNIGASLSLAGIAAVVLTIGMAVDANVLVFERIREEFKQSNKLFLSVQNGYKKAFSAILDSNVTTVIAALILLNFDAGPVKGFAVTLIIGIVSSMFTAYFVTRTFLHWWVARQESKSLNMSSWITNPNIAFLKFSPVVGLLSLVIAGFGGYALYNNQGNIYGMDFTGGYSMILEVKASESSDTKSLVEKALVKAGISQQDLQIRELSDSSTLRLFLAKSLDEQGKPFYDMPLTQEIFDPAYAYQTNPRLNYVVESLQKGDVELTDNSLKNVNFTFKSVSGQMSDAMRKNALIGLAIALLAILAYITIRFEFKYAISATLGLAYDLLVTVSILAVLHNFGVPIQIDLNAVAALLTIAGYSLNDTIIVFDRIREDNKMMEKMPFKDLVNRSLNVTLSRTLLTSMTTLIVLLCMVFLGGNSIFGFSLLMSIGVVVGTLSSFFISSVLLLLFDSYEKQREKALEEQNS